MNTEVYLSGKVSNLIKGGYEITLDGAARVFLPFREANVRRGQVKELIGQTIHFNVINAERRHDGLHLIVSRKNAVKKIRQHFFENIQDGQQVTGKVKSETRFGWFISLAEGIDGLLHKDNSSRQLKVGETITATVISFSAKNHKISLELE